MKLISLLPGSLRLATLSLLLTIGCGDDTSVHTIEEIREGRPSSMKLDRPASTAERFRMRRHSPGHSHGGTPGAAGGDHPQPRGFEYDLPDGWKRLPTRRFRDVNLTLERDSDVECYLSVLPGGGGGLVQNINRWRGQMGKEPLTETEIAALPSEKLLGTAATFVEMSGEFGGMSGGAGKPDYAFFGLVLEAPRTMLTLKMTGPASALDEERDNFLALAASLRLGDSSQPSGGAKVKAPPSTGGLAWDTPEGWTLTTGHHSMRLVSFHPAGDKLAECYVTILAGDAGGLKMNLDRWRGEVKSTPITAAEIEKLPTIEMLGRKAVFDEVYGDSYVGMAGKKVKDAGVLGVVLLMPGRTIFVKMTGPKKTVEAEKENFLAFCKSLRGRE